MAALSYGVTHRRGYRKPSKKARCIAAFAVATALLFGFSQAVTALIVSLERVIKIEALKDG